MFGCLLQTFAIWRSAEEWQHHSQCKPYSSKTDRPASYLSERHASAGGIGLPNKTTRPPRRDWGSVVVDVDEVDVAEVECQETMDDK